MNNSAKNDIAGKLANLPRKRFDLFLVSFECIPCIRFARDTEMACP